MPKALRLAFRVTFLVLLWKSGTKILFFQKPHTNFQRIISLKSTDISIILLRNTSFIFHENSLKLNIYLLYQSKLKKMIVVRKATNLVATLSSLNWSSWFDSNEQHLPYKRRVLTNWTTRGYGTSGGSRNHII